MVSSRTYHVSLIKDTSLLLEYYIIFLLHQSYKQAHFFHPSCKNVTLDDAGASPQIVKLCKIVN